MIEGSCMAGACRRNPDALPRAAPYEQVDKWLRTSGGAEPRILDRIRPSELWGGCDYGCRVAMNCDGARWPMDECLLMLLQ